MNRLPALLLAAYGALSFGCMDGSPLSPDEPLDGDFMALQVPADIGPPAPSGQIETVVQAPITAGSVEPPVGTKIMPVRIANITGTGCTRDLTDVRYGPGFDHVELRFDEDFFTIKLPASPSGAVLTKSLSCVIELRVRGIKGMEAAMHHVQYRGSSSIPANAVARAQTRIAWRDDEFESQGDFKDFIQRGPRETAWFHDHETTVTTKAARSRCFTSDQEEDIVYIGITSNIETSNKVTGSAFAVTFAQSITLNTAPQQSDSGAPIEYRITAAPCTP